MKNKDNIFRRDRYSLKIVRKPSLSTRIRRGVVSDQPQRIKNPNSIQAKHTNHFEVWLSGSGLAPLKLCEGELVIDHAGALR